jgi:hypothetical protein
MLGRGAKSIGSERAAEEIRDAEPADAEREVEAAAAAAPAVEDARAERV